MRVTLRTSWSARRGYTLEAFPETGREPWHTERGPSLRLCSVRMLARCDALGWEVANRAAIRGCVSETR